MHANVAAAACLCTQPAFWLLDCLSCLPSRQKDVCCRVFPSHSSTVPQQHCNIVLAWLPALTHAICTSDSDTCGRSGQQVLCPGSVESQAVVWHVLGCEQRMLLHCCVGLCLPACLPQPCLPQLCLPHQPTHHLVRGTRRLRSSCCVWWGAVACAWSLAAGAAASVSVSG